MAYQYVDNLPGKAKNQYKDKLRAEILEMCPYQLPECIRQDYPSLWPSVEYSDIYEFLIYTPGIHFSFSQKKISCNPRQYRSFGSPKGFPYICTVIWSHVCRKQNLPFRPYFTRICCLVTQLVDQASNDDIF